MKIRAACALALFSCLPAAAQARRVLDINPGKADSDPAELTPARGGLVFAATTGAVDRELWVTNGTGSGTTRVKDIEPGPNASKPDNFHGLGGLVVFRAKTLATGGYEPWVTDGTRSGTRLLVDINGNASGGLDLAVFGAQRWVSHAGKVFFKAQLRPATRPQLWSTDGTPGGTRATGMGDVKWLASLGDKLIYTDWLRGEQLGVGNGTKAGATKILVNPGGDAKPEHLTVHDGKCYFSAIHVGIGREPWVTDGTQAGTKQLATRALLKQAMDPSGFTGSGRAVFFNAKSPTLGRTLFVTYGSANSTRAIAAARDPEWITPIGDDQVVFAASNTVWISDGTNAGTKPVLPTRGPKTPSLLVRIGHRRVMFSANTQGNGREPWVTDGTAAGTKQVADLAIAAASSFPRWFTPFGCEVFFTATVPGYGDELYAARAGAVTTEVGRGCAPGIPPRLSATDAVLGQKLRFGGSASPNAPGVLVLGVPTPRGGSMIIGCPVYVDLFKAPLNVPLNSKQATWSLSFGVPNNPSLSCSALAAQAAYFTGSGQTTNGVLILPGK